MGNHEDVKCRAPDIARNAPTGDAPRLNLLIFLGVLAVESVLFSRKQA